MIPLLVTHDLELAPDHDDDGQQRALEALTQRLPVPTTAFATATAAEALRDAVRDFAAAGHEVACHGVAHGSDENLRLAPDAHAANVVRDATARLSAVVGYAPRCFRGPFSSTSAGAQRALIATGYDAEFSVCPGRLDFMFTRGGTPEWLRAPRAPYHPSALSPYRRGDLPLWVVPLSALNGIPFLSGVLYMGGLGVAKRVFDSLRRASSRTGAPVVYLFHSYEFAERRPSADHSPVPRKRLHRLYAPDRRRRLEHTLRLIDHMAGARDVTAMSGSEFVARCCAGKSEEKQCTSS